VQKHAVEQQEVTSDSCQIKQGLCKWPWPNEVLFWHLPAQTEKNDGKSLRIKCHCSIRFQKL